MHAADHESGDGGAGDQLLTMLADLATPVGQLGDPARSAFDRLGELAAAGRRCRCGSARWLRPGAPGRGGCGSSGGSGSLIESPPLQGRLRLLRLLDRHLGLRRRALLQRACRRSARRPRRRSARTSASIAKPTQIAPSIPSRSLISQATACMSIASASSTKTPAAIPTPAPLPSLVSFSVTSALASSISSRTRIETRSETSKTSSPTERLVLGSRRGARGGPGRSWSSAFRSVRRILVEDAPVDDRGDPRGDDARERAGAASRPTRPVS